MKIFDCIINSFKNNGWKFKIEDWSETTRAISFDRLELLTKATSEAAAIVDNYYDPATEKNFRIEMEVWKKKYWLVYEEID